MIARGDAAGWQHSAARTGPGTRKMHATTCTGMPAAATVSDRADYDQMRVRSRVRVSGGWPAASD